MIMGPKTRNRKSLCVQLDYIINIVEIKPWPPSQSLRSVRSTLIQWEHGDKMGSTKAVAPSVIFGLGVGYGKIEFNESFRVHVTLSRAMSVKAGENETFVRNCIEFNMYEPRRDNTVRGQLLASAILDFAEYGIVEESLTISVPMNSKRTFGNVAQPMLFVKIRTIEKNNRVRSSSMESLIREGPTEKNHTESVSALMNEEYAEEADTAAITDDDDVSSESSMAAGSSTFGSNWNMTLQREIVSQTMHGISGKVNDQEILIKDKRSAEPISEADTSLEESSQILSSTDFYSELENGHTTLFSLHDSRFTMPPQKAESYSLKQSKPFITNNGTNKEINANSRSHACANLHEKALEKTTFGKNDKNKAIESPVHMDSNASQSGWESQMIGDFESDADRLKSVKSVDSLSDSGFTKGSVRTNKYLEKLKNVGLHGSDGERNLMGNESKDISKVEDLERKIQILESELREAAAIEVSLYSVLAEHGHSVNKVHAPARRLSRLYRHACKDSASRRASAARSIVSGLILVAKACGNDVPRLTFWLSNSVVLRAIIHKTFEKGIAAVSTGQSSDEDGGIVEKRNNETVSTFKWKKESSSRENRPALHTSYDEWGEPHLVTPILENVESWIFSRIIESIWWQTLAPYMQSVAAKGIVRVIDSESNAACRMTSGSHDSEQANSSLELWRTAFMDACERICPVRAAGHDCGCLRVLSTLIMDQCIARLDVAMFNAILRESADEVPTDPVSDPVTDARVLPIPSGKASFGAGAQLKKTVGNWSRWLNDVLGTGNDFLTGENDLNCDENRKIYDAPFISFRLLNALSELMMLPKDMLLSNTIRKEVCPTIGVQVIKKILDSFIPDEFCPDAIPDVVLEALDSEDLIECCEDGVTSLPCVAAPIVYHPPSASLTGRILGDDERCYLLSRSGSSILRKSNTSDDELDELDSPLSSIIDASRTAAASAKPVWTLKDGSSRSTVRYQLLREVWMNSE